MCPLRGQSLESRLAAQPGVRPTPGDARRMSRASEALDRLRKAGAALSTLESVYPLEAPTFGPGCCIGELDELQEKCPLPEDYVEFLALCRRVVASDVFNGYYIYSPLGRPADSSIPRRLLVGVEPRLEDVLVLAVAGDGGGNQFLMAVGSEAAGQVWKWNHERPVRFDGVAREGLTVVAGSFTAFLERVAEDWEHFVHDDRAWSYISG